MDIGQTLELVRGAAELAKTFTGPTPQPNDPRQLRAVARLIAALRNIYFSPEGVIGLLQEISDGGYPSEEEIASILPEFNDGEDWVRRARYDLDDSQLRHTADLSLRANRVLGEISLGKNGVRTAVKELLNYPLTYGEQISPEQAQQMIDEIQLLNDAIEEAEERLRTPVR